jgi:hypothetical protein
MALRLGSDAAGVLADFRRTFQKAARECLGREVPLDARNEKDTLSHPDVGTRTRSPFFRRGPVRR